MNGSWWKILAEKEFGLHPNSDQTLLSSGWCQDHVVILYVLTLGSKLERCVSKTSNEQRTTINDSANAISDYLVYTLVKYYWMVRYGLPDAPICKFQLKRFLEKMEKSIQMSSRKIYKTWWSCFHRKLWTCSKNPKLIQTISKKEWNLVETLINPWWRLSHKIFPKRLNITMNWSFSLSIGIFSVKCKRDLRVLYVIQ